MNEKSKGKHAIENEANKHHLLRCKIRDLAEIYPFCKKSVKPTEFVIKKHFMTVSRNIFQVWKSTIKSDHDICGKVHKYFFRQINVFNKEVTEELISRVFFRENAFYSTFLKLCY